MRIKRLEIYGFKSFPYRVTLPFPPGISAIVGPNGSGKSNIIDALRWVLGEQSLKRLRVRAAEDLLFAGDHGQSPSFAEVRLVLENHGQGPEDLRDLPEIVVARRLYRSGESEYLLNNRACRLKDIQYLFLDTGVNPKGYGLIDQGEVGKFLEWSPQERRFFLEELAGVSRYRANREETLRNLKRTRENLARVEDLLSEIRNQLEHLEEQAQLAERFLALRKKLKHLSLTRLALLYQRSLQNQEKAQKKLEELRQNLSTLSRREEALLPVYEEILSQVNTLKRKEREKEEALKSLEEVLRGLSEKLRLLYREESEISKKLEREKARRESLQETAGQLEGELKKLSSEVQNLKKLLEKEETEFKALQEKYSLLKKRIEEAERNFREKEKEFLALKEKLNFMKDRKKTLEKEIQGLAEKEALLSQKAAALKGEKDKLRSREEALCREIKGLEEDLSAVQEKRKVLEEGLSGLKEKLREILDQESKIRLDLRSLEKEKAMLLSLWKQESPIDPEKLEAAGLELKTLAETLEVSPEKMEATEALLGEKLSFPVIESRGEAERFKKMGGPGFFYRTPHTMEKLLFEIQSLEVREKLDDLWESLPGKPCYFSQEKALWSPLGFLVFFSREAPGLLRLRKRLEEIERDLVHQRSLLEDIRNKKEALTKERKALEEELSRKTREIREKEVQRKRIHGNLTELKKEITRLEREEAFVSQEISLEVARSQSVVEEKAKLEEEIRKISFAVEETLREENERRQRYETLKGELAREEKVFKEKSLRLSELSERLKILSRRKIESEENSRRTRERLRQTSQQVKVLEDELQFVRNLIHQEKKTRKEKEKFKEKILREKRQIEETLARARERLSDLEREGKALEKDRERIRERIHRLELDLAEARMTLEHLRREALENYETELEDFLAKEKLEHKEPEKIEEEILRTREKLSSFPPVNLAAAEELARTRERFEFLSTQKEDLLKTIRDLEAARRRLDEESRRKMREALVVANRKLAEVFPLLFEGGRAELYFTDSEDPLEAGLDLKVKLPGKPVKHLAMLSGGEKALCALAVLFSFYLVKPGPFCILDEVDAPLDEANTLKFNELLKSLKEHSQVILITHNPQVMEIADALFGVTMEEKGISKIVSVKLV